MCLEEGRNRLPVPAAAFPCSNLHCRRRRLPGHIAFQRPQMPCALPPLQLPARLPGPAACLPAMLPG